MTVRTLFAVKYGLQFSLYVKSLIIRIASFWRVKICSKYVFGALPHAITVFHNECVMSLNVRDTIIKINTKEKINDPNCLFLNMNLISNTCQIERKIISN